MKKILVTLLFAFLMLAGTDAYAQFSFGGNYTYVLETSVVSGADKEIYPMHGFQAGIGYNIPFGEDAIVGFQPCVNVAMLFGANGSGANRNSFVLQELPRYKELVINAPMNFTVGFSQDCDFNVYVYFGPVIQYGFISETSVPGKEVFTLRSNGLQYQQPYTLNNYKGDTTNNVGADRRQFNMLLGGGLGIQWGDNLNFLFGYERSFMNYSLQTENKIVRNYFKAGIAFAF